LIKDDDADIEALRSIIMKEHLQKKGDDVLKVKENPGSIKKSRKAEKRNAWNNKGKKKPRKQKWDLTPSHKLKGNNNTGNFGKMKHKN